MFTYLHCYMPQTWEAQIKAGLIRPDDGIRFSQSLDIDESLKFNNLAAVGGDLYNYVKEHNCPFYIDRLQGGCFLEEYPYDMELVNTYRTMLGDKFWASRCTNGAPTSNPTSTRSPPTTAPNGRQKPLRQPSAVRSRMNTPLWKP